MRREYRLFSISTCLAPKLSKKAFDKAPGVNFRDAVSIAPTQFTRQGIAYIIREAGTARKLGHVWPHMLRHSCGYHLANLSQVPDLRLIQDYLGHKNIKNTARYTRTSARRFEGLWD